MKVISAEEMGMCFGVRDALKTLENVANPKAVTIHGQLVHNEVVLEQLGARGFHMASEQDRGAIPDTGTVLITAHGISERERVRLTHAGKTIVDTTCPLVRRVHDTAMKLQREGYHILIIGRANHVEVQGIVEDLEHFEVVESASAVKTSAAKRLAVICQTTVAPSTVAAIHAAIVRMNLGAEIRFIDTTCHPTRNRQHAVERLIPLVQAMVVVGGSNSNNTRELVELARRHGMKTWQVSAAKELKKEWFTGIDCVGLTAGTSTLDETIDEVRRWLQDCQLQTAEQRHSEHWKRHFQVSLEKLLTIPWDAGAALTDDERRAIIPSIQDMQLCESSNGANGLRLAARYAEHVDDPQYVDSLRLFFAEENRHSAYLKRYLDLANETTVQKSWSDFCFRRLRRLMGLETFITVLLIAEMIGMVCYRAFRQASQCDLLRKICSQLMRDETSHLRFHIERLRLMQAHRPRWLRFVNRSLQRCVFSLACLGVWRKHGRGIRKGGYFFRKFWRETHRELNKALAQINSERTPERR